MNFLKVIAIFLDVILGIVGSIVAIIGGMFLAIWLIGITVGAFIYYFRKDK
jgi:hypothetical protein